MTGGGVNHQKDVAIGLRLVTEAESECAEPRGNLRPATLSAAG
jgi:hypothetical protein